MQISISLCLVIADSGGSIVGAYFYSCIRFLMVIFFFSLSVARGDEINYCTDIGLGEVRKVKISRRDSATGLSANYLLTRLNERIYSATFALDFKSDGQTDRQDIDLMYGRVQACLKEINTHLYTRDGYHLVFNIVPQESVHDFRYRDILQSIVVGEHVKRVYSTHYDTAMDCRTLAHELFHLTGLVDEYPDADRVQPGNLDCRSYGPFDSLMRSPAVSALGHVYNRSGYIRSCLCQTPGLCSRYSDVEKDQMKSCPKGYSAIEMYGLLSTQSYSETVSRQSLWEYVSTYMKTEKQSRIEYKADDIVVLGVQDSTKPQDSWIYPAYVRNVIYPSCKIKNSIYYACSAEAYSQVSNTIGCGIKPTSCYSQRWLD